MKANHSNRRDFISKIALGSLGAISIPQLAFAAPLEQQAKKIALRDNDIILFQGDSITDAGRSRSKIGANHQEALGGGYAFLAAAELLAKNPGKNLKVFNRGVSGHKVHQLAERWEKDTLELKPTILSIMIGVNDFWHVRTHGYKGTLQTYKTDYRALLQQTKDKLPEVKLILLEPFAIVGSAVDNTWFPAFNDYQQTVRELSQEFDAAYVPFQKIFNKALGKAPGTFWIPDGVHPTVAGAKLMADAWLNLFKD